MQAMAQPQTLPTLVSPNQKVAAQLTFTDGQGVMNIDYKKTANEWTTIVPRMAMGVETSQQSFFKGLTVKRYSKVKAVHDEYAMPHGKSSMRTNDANEMTITVENADKAQMDIIVRAYNDGVAFRYRLNDKRSKCTAPLTFTEEKTSYTLPKGYVRWLEKWNPANEGLYTKMTDCTQQGEWAYPALFCNADTTAWALITESDIDRNYCATRLVGGAPDNDGATVYNVAYPTAWEGRDQGERLPSVQLPWQSPWRVAIVGDLGTIVASTLVDDVARPSIFLADKKADTSWIKPGVASWNYWSDNHGTLSYETVCQFADLAKRMNWPYTLLDWEWDRMHAQPELAKTLPHGGNLEDAIAYIKGLGITPLMWYNSNGTHSWVESTPKDRMLTHENRVEEFTKLQRLGVKGVKIDFFESEKQDMMRYYLDILDDAAKFQMMIYFHGCLVPRGWQRTYPHLMTYEGVRGEEWYNNGPEFTTTAPEHNCVLPFTRNVVGSMDYTPTAFTNSQYPHITSSAHELALAVLFESGIQHIADRPEGIDRLPAEARALLSGLPNAWDETRLLSGFPGESVVMARRKGNTWYVAGITSNNRRTQTVSVPLSFLPEGSWQATMLADGVHDQAFSISRHTFTSSDKASVRLLRRGGFVMKIE